MTYEVALAYIASLAPRGWRLGLDRMQEFALRIGLEDALGAPDGPQYIHIGGTNGKGSTTAYVQSILHESGYRVGSFFSPYVYNPRERIQLGRELIPEGIFAGLTAMLQPVAEEFTETEFGGISEFEFKAAMAFLFYKRLKCEWVALEVGLGGRLDATNIVTPRCSVITSIGLDHTNILGNSIEAIAQEKAGIIKPGVPVIVGQVPAAALEVIEATAADKKSTIWRYGREVQVAHSATDLSIVVTTPFAQHAGLELGIKGAMQGHNMAIAVAACDAAGATRTLGGLQRGTANAAIPGRFEIRRVDGKLVILDGAHNAEAAGVLADTLIAYLDTGELPGNFVPPQPASNQERRVRLVTNMVAGHEPKQVYQALAPLTREAYVVPIPFPRALAPESVAEVLRDLSVPASVHTVGEGIRKALDDCGDQEVVLVTGSFYLLEAVDKALRELPG